MTNENNTPKDQVVGSGSPSQNDYADAIGANIALADERNHLRDELREMKAKGLSANHVGSIPTPTAAAEYWKNDAIDKAADLADRFGEPHIGEEIRRMKTNTFNKGE